MNIETLREYCLQKSGAEEGFPFGEETLVFKVGGKIFLLIGMENANAFNVKCDPETAVALREQYPEVQPGFHMNKRHWNTVQINGRLTEPQLVEMINHSYHLVLRSLPKKIQETL